MPDRLRRLAALPALLAACLFLAACGGDTEPEQAEEVPAQTPDPAPPGLGVVPEDEFEVELAAVEDSGVSGTATLRREGEHATVVEIVLDGAARENLAWIDAGTCDELQHSPVHELEPVTEGSSTTTVEATLEELVTQTQALAVVTPEHEELACGDILYEDAEGEEPAER